MIRAHPDWEQKINMCKRINQKRNSNGTIKTFTTGRPEGSLPNFDVNITSPPRHFKEPTEMTFSVGNKLSITLDGRQARTLNEVLNRHFEKVQ